MVLWRDIVFAIFLAVKLKTYWRNNSNIPFYTLQYYFKMASTIHYFYEQAKHIRGLQTNVTFSPRPLNSLLAFMKNILELEEWTDRNEEFSKWTNIKQQGPHRNLVDVSRINVISPVCFHQNRMGNCNNKISSEEHFENSKIMRGSYL